MAHLHHTSIATHSNGVVVVLVLASLWYARGLGQAQRAAARGLPAWRGASFLVGLFLVWAALGSPLVAYAHELLTVHMIQHLLLMTIAPALILLGEPQLAFWYGMPESSRAFVNRWLDRPFVRQLARAASTPAVCWTMATVTLVGWHVPALFTLALRSDVWHSVEQASFLGAGLLFWWPVILPWPSVAALPQWSTLLYLFFATLPCDALSGFLVFSDRVAYPAYFSMPRHTDVSVLQDQQCAAALMWTGVTLVYLVPAAVLSTRLLSPRSV